LHHDRFAGAEEKDVSINAESLPSDSAKTTQDHLSVEMRWPNDSDGCCDGDEHEDVKRYPDLKLEFFTDQGMCLYACACLKVRHPNRRVKVHTPIND
jgi:hypothetical protein